MKVLPPAVELAPPARPVIDGARMVVWSLRGLWHGVSRKMSSRRQRAVAGVLFGTFAIMSPVLLVMTPAMIARRAARYYMTPGRDAVLAVTRTRRGWQLSDHLTAKPGESKGEALRSSLIPELLPYADAHGVIVSTTAATRELGERYRAEVAGLQFVSDKESWPRGWKMRREPVAVQNRTG